MKIYQARIDTYEQYEGQGNPAYIEFGANLQALWARWNAAGAKIAPDDDWTSHADGMGCEVTVDGVQYVARIEPIELVC